MKPLLYFLLPATLFAFGCSSPKSPALDLLDIRLYKDAAERGDAQTQAHLGTAYATQLRFPEANYWYLKAAKQGRPEAQYGLGLDYNEGAGVPKDPIEAYAWFSVASTQGHLAARNARESLRVKLTRSETEAGERRTAELLRIILPQDLEYLWVVDVAQGITNAQLTPRQAEQHYVPMKQDAHSTGTVTTTGVEHNGPVFQEIPGI